jgi:hypothetical protein
MGHPIISSSLRAARFCLERSRHSSKKLNCLRELGIALDNLRLSLDYCQFELSINESRNLPRAFIEIVNHLLEVLSIPLAVAGEEHEYENDKNYNTSKKLHVSKQER